VYGVYGARFCRAKVLCPAYFYTHKTSSLSRTETLHESIRSDADIFIIVALLCPTVADLPACAAADLPQAVHEASAEACPVAFPCLVCPVALPAFEDDLAPNDALDLLDGSYEKTLFPGDLLHSQAAHTNSPPEPLDRQHLPTSYYLHGLFEEDFLDLLTRLAENLPGDTASNNMSATRRFFSSEKFGEALLARLPRCLGYSRVMPAMRFIEYEIGGFIRPHTDGVMFDDVSKQQTTTSFLLYLQDTPTEGTTNFLDAVADGTLLHTISPRRGSILLFPHNTPHEGSGVGAERKVLLRGDLF
jgi:hypothetical protein